MFDFIQFYIHERLSFAQGLGLILPSDVASWHIASHGCGEEFGRYRGIAYIWSSPDQSSSIYEYAPPGTRGVSSKSHNHFNWVLRPSRDLAGRWR